MDNVKHFQQPRLLASRTIGTSPRLLRALRVPRTHAPPHSKSSMTSQIVVIHCRVQTSALAGVIWYFVEGERRRTEETSLLKLRAFPQKLTTVQKVRR